jgi:hypothetical protein
MKSLAFLLLGSFLFSLPLAAQGRAGAGSLIPSELVMGRAAKVRLAGTDLKGELIAVSPDSLWLSCQGALNGFPLQDVEQVNVEMHKWGGKRVFIWSLVAGLGSGLALTGACNSVSGASCGGIIPAVGLSWAVVGGVSGLLLHRGSTRMLPMTYEGIRPYVRYPQGLPPEAWGSKASGDSGGG